jgi:hypothetical protein
MLGITWSLIFLISSIFGISIYKISGQKHLVFMKDVKIASIWNNDEPEGWIIGKWYIGYVHKTQSNRGDTSELLILCHKKYYNINISKNEDDDATIAITNTTHTLHTANTFENNTNTNTNIKINKFTFYERDGNSYYSLFYNNRRINCTSLTPRPYQQEIIETIHNDYITNMYNYTVVLLYGEPGKGKSMIPYFLIKWMLSNPTNAPIKYKKISLVDTFNPIQPGDKFTSLYTKIAPTKDYPLIIVIEEIDIMLNAIHTNTVLQHRDIPIQITNKIDWNMFFDRFDKGLYPHIIFIMTTNKSANYFDELDISYMRKGRVNLKCEVKYDL